MKQSARNYKRIVIKVGSSFLCVTEELGTSVFEDVARQVSTLVKEGKEVIVVSSGAIALGMHTLGLKQRPGDLSSLQAAAAIGQNALMDNYSNNFRRHKINCAQILLTWDDFDNRERYLNAKNTLMTLLKLGVVPIINENDTISTEEIKFGDNDRLSALVASLVSADLLVILSDVDGLLDKENKLVRVVDEITPAIKSLACPTNKKTCVGGMITKLEAASIATGSGISCVIANGCKKDIISSVIDEPTKHGTLFISQKNLDAKERWLAFGTKQKGKIIVDEGAKNALINKKSLLSVGVVDLEGNFEVNDIVSVIDKCSREIARGKVGLSSKQLERVKGSRHDKEVIHRDNIVVL